MRMPFTDSVMFHLDMFIIEMYSVSITLYSVIPPQQ